MAVAVSSRDPANHSTADPLVEVNGPDCGTFDIRIDRNGVWHYRNSPIDRKEMVCLFAGLLERRADGTFWLVTPFEAGRIEVDDAPFLAVEMFVNGAGREAVVSFRTNVDELVTLDAKHPLKIRHDPETGCPLPYVTVRDGLEARLTRAVYYELVAHGFEEKMDGQATYGVWSNGTFFPMGRPD